jgi:hypothetical protein
LKKKNTPTTSSNVPKYSELLTSMYIVPDKEDKPINKTMIASNEIKHFNNPTGRHITII